MAARRRVASFDDFFSAFSKSVHADVHLRDGEVVVSQSSGLLNEALGVSSTVNTQACSLPRLLPLKDSSPSKSASTAVIDGSLPRHLAALVSLQTSNGSWCFDDKFQFVIQDVAAPPPEGISTKLWATAVVVTIFRQCPEYFAQLEPAYDKAMLHVDDDILRLASAHVSLTEDAMERIRPYQNSEAKEIRERLAREAAAKRAEEDAEEARLACERHQAVVISKYSAFKARHFPMGTQELVLSALSTEVGCVFPSTTTRTIPKQLRPVEMEIRTGDTVECCWRRVDGARKPERQPQWSLCLVTAVNSNGETINIHYLNDPFERERNVRRTCVRLTHEDAKDRQARAFESLKETWQAPCPMPKEMKRLNKIEQRRKWRQPWNVQSLPNLPKVAPTKDVGGPVPCDKSLTYSPLRRLTITPESFRRKYAIDRAQEGLYEDAVAGVLSYDKQYTMLRSTLTGATNRYAAAVLFQDRFHAFDEFLDQAVMVVTHSVTALECIAQWTKSNPGKLIGSFVWHGDDFVTRLLQSLDYLSAHKELVEWYGEGFAFSMNPFLMSKSLRDLAEDQGFRVSQKLKSIAPENPLRSALRMHKQEIESTDGSRTIPLWWPETRFDAELRERIHSAEAFVLNHLTKFGYLIPSPLRVQ